MADSVPSERTPSERAERAAADRGERTPPHNLDAERSVLGGILIRNDTYNHAAALIDGDDFYRDAHRRIFNAMVELNERGDAIDLITLKEALTRTGEIEDVGGVAYLARLLDGVPKATNVEHYATIVKEKSTLRALIASLQDSLQEAYAGAEDADEILDTAEKRVFEVADKRIRTGFIPIADLVQDSFDTLSKLQQHRGLVSGVPTAFTSLA
jgi:replicative DNA helicase